MCYHSFNALTFRAYLSSPPTTAFGEMSAAEKVSGMSLLSNSEPEAGSLLVTRTSVPQHAYQAFELLSRSAEAQVLTELHLLDKTHKKLKSYLNIQVFHSVSAF